METVCEILEIGLVDNEFTVYLNLPHRMVPAAGQYILGVTRKFDEILPTVLYYSQPDGERTILTGSIPPSWVPGDQVIIRGPFGKGFQIPLSARRVVIAPIINQFSRLLPVVRRAVTQKAAVSLYSKFLPSMLPPEVEVLHPDALSDSWNWADYFVSEVTPSQIHELRVRLGIGSRDHLPCAAQVLILGDFACAGMADCGVCAVKSGGRYMLACKDGPVFDLNSLEF